MPLLVTVTEELGVACALLRAASGVSRRRVEGCPNRPLPPDLSTDAGSRGVAGRPRRSARSPCRCRGGSTHGWQRLVGDALHVQQAVRPTTRCCARALPRCCRPHGGRRTGSGPSQEFQPSGTVSITVGSVPSREGVSSYVPASRSCIWDAGIDGGRVRPRRGRLRPSASGPGTGRPRPSLPPPRRPRRRPGDGTGARFRAAGASPGRAGRRAPRPPAEVTQPLLTHGRPPSTSSTSPNSTARALRPRERRDFTVPSAIPSSSAIWCTWRSAK